MRSTIADLGDAIQSQKVARNRGRELGLGVPEPPLVGNPGSGGAA